MLSQAQCDLITACVPALRAHGLTLTKVFYGRMFAANPELKNIFNMSRQATGEQQQALANAVLGYAEHIEHPEVLAPVLGIIAGKHASLGIRAEHYPIVGRHLLDAIAEVMGDAATPEVIEAWAAAYGQLADLLIAKERELYAAATALPGGWSGWRPFRLVRRQRESEDIMSFYLSPADGGAIPPFKPGQYVSVRTQGTDGVAQIRQYSLSDAPHEPYLRLTVKLEDGAAAAPAGTVSSHLHAAVQEGQCLDLSAPQGDFTVDQSHARPLVLISGGVGVTPMASILGHLAATQPQRRVLFLHATRHRRTHAMNDWLRKTAGAMAAAEVEVYYEQVAPDDRHGHHYDHHGRIDLASHQKLGQFGDADYYICGPRPFMAAQVASLAALGVDDARIHTEVFGSALG